jgi:hypothetical protein
MVSSAPFAQNGAISWSLCPDHPSTTGAFPKGVLYSNKRLNNSTSGLGGDVVMHDIFLPTDAP